jgi:hypothetical protein
MTDGVAGGAVMLRSVVLGAVAMGIMRRRGAALVCNLPRRGHGLRRRAIGLGRR